MKIGIVGLPNVGKSTMFNSITKAIVEFVDIAGLVKGASKGEGLGNKFLSHIREVDAICQVVRCFEDPNVIHVDGSVPGRSYVELKRRRQQARSIQISNAALSVRK